jgi:octaprenyl-diphosphate synthase
MKDIKKMTLYANLLAIAIILNIVESLWQVIPVPGAKIGLANIVTVIILFVYKPKDSIYFVIIRQKTATLIAACCALGACSVVPNDTETIEKMRKFGELIGMAFQIKDDLFDYTEDAIGKPTGIDIKEQKMTLPLIYTLNHCSKQEKSWVINSIKNHNKDKKRVAAVIQFVKDQKGLAYAEQKMIEFQQKALHLLDEFPDSEYKSALELMVNYVIERKK